MNLSAKSLNEKVIRFRRISKYIIPGFIALAVILAEVACSDNGASDTQVKVKATWIQEQIEDETISLSVDQVSEEKIVHFDVPVQNGNVAFMAYDLDGDIIVRANVCPPCQSSGFSLEGDRLVCDNCGTTFKADTGKGISGACVNYPKDSVSYEITGGELSMQWDDMLTAYMDTIEAG